MSLTCFNYEGVNSCDTNFFQNISSLAEPLNRLKHGNVREGLRDIRDS